MPQVLLIVDAATHTVGHAVRSSLTMTGAAASILRCSYDILVIAQKDGRVAAAGLAGYGARRVLVLEDDSFDLNVTETLVDSVALTAKDYTLVVAAANSLGLELLPRLAGLLDAGYVAECSGVGEQEGALTFRRSLYAGNVTGWVRLETPVQLVTVRTSHFAPAAAIASESPIERCAVSPMSLPAGSIELVELTDSSTESPRLTEAQIIVAGGRPFRSKLYQVLQPLADALGAVIGATRSACIAGFASFDCQIGQTGKVVTPQVYFAIGISGAVQHMAGIKGAKLIVAINKNPQAPIFRWADYGLVADMFETVPALVECLARRNDPLPCAANAR
jgi:electron transfer flavoprotein alpha subunit